MFKNLYLSAALCLSFFLFLENATAQTGCPGCIVNLPPLPEDTIFLSAAPDGEAGVYYDGTISFRMPKTTTPVNDPGTPAGLNINKITIVSVVNVPAGLQWETNQNEFNPQDETDGCVKFCGTPLQPGMYEVEVFVTAEVSIFNQSTSFSFPIYIAPSSSSTDGFSMQNSSGCGEVTVDFTNNLPSNGISGYSYFWDFGNGSTSTDENPGQQTYSAPGIYEVNYEASVDTFGYQMLTVHVLDAGCGDPISIPTSAAPDLYIKVKNPAGTIIFETTPIDNVPFPTAFNVNLPLLNGEYTLEVRDDDLIGSQGCGEILFDKFTLPTDTLLNGDLKIKMNIVHPVSTVQSTDTVFVYEIPSAPIIEPNGLVEACEGTAVELLASYTENLQWHKDTSLLLNQNAQNLTVTQAGNYWVEYTSPDGCKSQSEQVEVAFIPNPAAPAFHAEGNLLVLNNPNSLPSEYSLQWYVDNVIQPGETDLEFCITTPGTSLYTLVLLDETTGCSSEFTLGATFDPSIDCTSASGEMAALGQSLRIFPNPFSDFVTIVFENQKNQPITVSVFDGMGRLILEKNLFAQMGRMEERLDCTSFSAGIYFVKIQTAEGMVSSKILKK